MESENKHVVYSKHVVFWGGEFGNFHKCNLIYKNFLWSSSEQAYQAEKAAFFNDYGTLFKIMMSTTPKEAKEIGQTVSGFDKELWNKASFDIMYDIVLAKFSQNNKLKEMLISDELLDKHFVEGSPVDGIWGVRVAWNDPRVDDESNWNGENRLGKVLDKVRETLLEKNKQLKLF